MTQLIDCIQDDPGSRPDGSRPLSPNALLEVALDLARDASTWRALARHDPAERWFVRLAFNDCFDTWLIGWHARQGVDLHDHGGSAGALYVVEGELLETAMGFGGDSRLVEQRLTAGTARAFAPSHVHWIVNPTPRVATSVHVYSPPLSRMGFYELETDMTLRPRGSSPVP
ncbi:MAG TPA: cysteine dioxygenase family protein [Acidimicrobiia bacterium]|nr:cysteine dioxygenase family protein [Acidimicrobiia bacterium]